MPYKDPIKQAFAVLNSKFLKRYGISIERRDEMRVEQDNRCAICHRIFVETPHVDHDHATKTVRELLCGDCNWGIGCFGENIDTLKNAIDYLLKHGKSPNDLTRSVRDRNRN